jgi:hypothetical protein
MFVWWCCKPPGESSGKIAYWYFAYNDGAACGVRQPGVEPPLSARSGRSIGFTESKGTDKRSNVHGKMARAFSVEILTTRFPNRQNSY